MRKTVYEMIQELAQYDFDDEVEITCTLQDAIVETYDEVDSYEVIASCEKTDEYFTITTRKEKGKTIIQLGALFEN